MAIPLPGEAATKKSFWKAIAEIWKRTVNRGITICRGLDAAPVGRLSAEDSINKSILVIMRNGSSCVSRRKPLF